MFLLKQSCHKYIFLVLFLFRLNFSTAWSTNTVSICHSAGLTNITRVELSRRFLIKVCAPTQGGNGSDRVQFPQVLCWGGTLGSLGSDLLLAFLMWAVCLSVSGSPRIKRAWRISVVILRSWLNACMTTWPNASITIPSPPSPWRWNPSRCLRWIFCLKAAQLWREPTTIWVSLLLFFLPPSPLHSLTCVLLSLLACLSALLQLQWVLPVCCSASSRHMTLLINRLESQDSSDAADYLTHACFCAACAWSHTRAKFYPKSQKGTCLMVLFRHGDRTCTRVRTHGFIHILKLSLWMRITPARTL